MHKQRYTPAFDRVTEDIVSVEITVNASITTMSIRYCPPGVMVIVLLVTCCQIINEGLGTPEHWQVKLVTAEAVCTRVTF